MKKNLYLIGSLFLLGTAELKAQSKIKDGSVSGSSSLPNANAIMELESSSKGLLFPRVALSGTSSASPLSAHIAGMVVYNTATTSDVVPGFYCSDGSQWKRLSTANYRFYSENSTASSTAATATGTSAVAIGEGAQAADFYMLSQGYLAGSGTTGAMNSNFIGNRAGASANYASYSNFIGNEAGQSAVYSGGSNFIGAGAGKSTYNAGQCNFIGSSAGFGVTGAQASNFIGYGAGAVATNAGYSNFLGYEAGRGATNAANSIFIGSEAGFFDSVDNTVTGRYSILIGNKTKTGGYSNSIALGNASTNTAANQLMIGSSTHPIHNTVIKGTGSLLVPVGTTAERPSTPAFGMIRYNSTIGRGEMYVNDQNGDGTLGDAGWRAL